ncbi:hypothetical protein B9Z19DRAFT_1091970 [Tuber borchii]|uniref:Uncharacterized protein n=1 Tax=Tuber borchii TaxID=42251 RepID=A0A2T6ZH43_TUBBO|nr:hypothetical protein B9Z19DRAFT_1091970 [Tuber borchii]
MCLVTSSAGIGISAEWCWIGMIQVGRVFVWLMPLGTAQRLKERGIPLPRVRVVSEFGDV